MGSQGPEGQPVGTEGKSLSVGGDCCGYRGVTHVPWVTEDGLSYSKGFLCA